LLQQAEFDDGVVFRLPDVPFVEEASVVEYDVEERQGLVLPCQAYVVVLRFVLRILLIEANQL
jgi:hypothetical protein